MLRDLGLDVVPDDPAVVASGEMELKSWIDSSVRDAVAKAVAGVNERLNDSLPPALVERLSSTPPADPSSLETRTFYQVSDFTDERPKSDNARKGRKLGKGAISLQGHDPTTDLSFRNIRIAELPRKKKR